MKFNKIVIALLCSFGSIHFVLTEPSISLKSEGVSEESSWSASFGISSAIAYTQSECDYLNWCDPDQHKTETPPTGGQEIPPEKDPELVAQCLEAVEVQYSSCLANVSTVHADSRMLCNQIPETLQRQQCLTAVAQIRESMKTDCFAEKTSAAAQCYEF